MAIGSGASPAPPGCRKRCPTAGRLRESQLQFPHIAAAHRLGKARDGRDAHLGLLRERADAGARRARQIVENQRGDLALGRAQFRRTFGDARDDIEGQRLGG
ncbi:hypothetical protein GGD41_005520 [Paraburkholderia bryophila]|uniref:Uncharacterized protein n=1 Tax=Paraburkholderia bryophila TaxID=420952 RepID=A0A7Z0B3F0_9BURK|nr:hypothetical protein [Paraburkholderia bryophila]